MNFFAFFRFAWLRSGRRQKQPHVNPSKQRKYARLEVEAFEDRLVPSGTPALGSTVIADVNANGTPTGTVNTGWITATPTPLSGPVHSVIPSALPQWNTSLGQLTSVDIEEVVSYHTIASLQNTSISSANTITLEADLAAILTSSGISDLDVSQAFAQKFSPFDAAPSGTVDANGKPLDSTTLDMTNPNLVASQTLTSPSDLAAFTKGVVPISEDINGMTTVSGLAQMNNTVTSTGSAAILVRYHYTQPADLAIVKEASPTSVGPGGTVTYTLNVTNNGPNTANGVTVQDTLPTGETFVSDTAPSGWTAQSTTNGVTFTAPSMASGAPAATFTVTVTAPTTPATYTNTATVSSQTPDSNPNNNQAPATITVTPVQDDLAILKSATPTNVLPGGTVTYTLTVSNNGPSTANGVTVQDTLPTGETLISATPPAGWTEQSTTGGVTFSAPSLAAGAAPVTFTITVTAPSTAGTFTNTATVSSQTPDSNPNNNQAPATITVTPAQDDLAILKSATPTNVLPGGTVTYTLTVSNNGPNTANGVTVQDTLPTGETLVSATPPAGWTEQSTTGGVTFSAPSLAAGAPPVIFTITVTAPNTAGTFTNTATVSSLTPDSNPNNNQAPATITVTPVQDDLAILKSATPTSVLPGGTVAYTLTVTNNGPSTATGVTVQDTLPAGETLVSATLPAGWTEQSTTGGVTFSAPSLAAGAPPAIFTVNVTAPSAAGTFTNTATVSSLTPDSDPSNNQAPATITVTPAQDDLAILKSATPTSVLPGGTVTYTLTVSNNGPNTATGVTVQDTLPAGETLVSATPPAGWTEQSTTGGVTFSAPSLTAGAAPVTFTITVTAPSTAGTFTNTATVSSLTPDSNPNNNQAPATITVTPAQDDLAITKSATPTSVLPGGTVAYTLTVTNNGPSTANGVTVQDTLPAGETFVSDTAPAGWTAQSTTGGVTFTAPSLAAGAPPVTFTVNVTAPSTAGTFTNTATVSSLTPDSDPSNNQAPATITVTPAQDDLAITKSATPTSVLPGGTVTYTLTISNNGPNTANGVTVQDTLPAGETFVSDTAPAGWTAQSTTGGVTFTAPSLAAGAPPVTFTVNVTAPNTAGSYTNTATVSSLTPDSNPSNNQAPATITVTPAQTDLAITKIASPTTVLPGGTVTYTLTVSNNGPNTANGVSVQDTLPAGETFVSDTAPAGWTAQSTSGGVLFTAPSLAAGAAPVTFTITVAAPTTSGSYTNTATVSSLTPDSNPSNNQAPAIITVTPAQADLSIVKTASPTSVQAGGSVTYTFTVTNNGPSAATNVVVQDALPVGEVLTKTTPPSGWTVQSTTGNVMFLDPSMAAGETDIITINVKAPSTQGQYANTATITSLTPDLTPNNNSSTATITVTPGVISGGPPPILPPPTSPPPTSPPPTSPPPVTPPPPAVTPATGDPLSKTTVLASSSWWMQMLQG